MSDSDNTADEDNRDGRDDLRRGWTTGACATAATKAAWTALLTGSFPDPVQITLPKGQQPEFALAIRERNENSAKAGVVKDAGDDPDVTHGALIIVEVARADPGSGVTFRAGDGVGTITKPGLPIPPGEPAINPVPRQLMQDVIAEVAAQHDAAGDAVITISVPGGEKIARQTWNPRLGIEGGISILGTTGIVIPYSCAAWIHSIHRGIDVARALETPHVAACVGSTSERMVESLYDLPETAYLDMGDFVGGMLKYLRKHPVKKISIAGGVGKFAKLANGAMDLHSSRSQVDMDFLAGTLAGLGAGPDLVARARTANTALDVLTCAGTLPLADTLSAKAYEHVMTQLRGAETEVEILISDRQSNLIGRYPKQN
ncbi:MAG: cobalt-precorrin-5B (C(1))-methyltransferase [Hyphomicrobiaceae bacterium]